MRFSWPNLLLASSNTDLIWSVYIYNNWISLIIHSSDIFCSLNFYTSLFYFFRAFYSILICSSTLQSYSAESILIYSIVSFIESSHWLICTCALWTPIVNLQLLTCVMLPAQVPSRPLPNPNTTLPLESETKTHPWIPTNFKILHQYRRSLAIHFSSSCPLSLPGLL